MLLVSCIDGNSKNKNQSNEDRIEQMKLDSIRQDSIALKKFEEKIKKKKCYFLCFYEGMSDSSFETALKYLKSNKTLDKHGYWLFATKNYEHYVFINPRDYSNSSVGFEFVISGRNELNEILQLYQSKYGAYKSADKKYSSMYYDQSKDKRDIFPDKNSSAYFEGMNDETLTYETMYWCSDTYIFQDSITSVSLIVIDNYLCEQKFPECRYQINMIYSAYKKPVDQPDVDKNKFEQQKEFNRETTRKQI